MASYQLPITITLTACVFCSVALFISDRSPKSELRLSDGMRDATSSDPFDTMVPEDFVNGEPIDEKRFWSRMRRRKLSLSFSLAILLVIEATQLAWSLLNGNLARDAAALYVTRVGFALYLVLVSAFAVLQEHGGHWRAVLHLASLTGVAVFLLGIHAIVPSQSLPTPANETDPPSSTFLPSQLLYLTNFLYIIPCALAVTIPRGPRLYFPPEKIYSNKIAKPTTLKNLGNVCEILSASVWDRLFFLYITKVVRISTTVETLEINELPIVPVDMRAPYIFATMRAAARKWKLQIGSWRPRLGSGWELSYRLIRVNSLAILQTIAASGAAAFMYYLPPLLLQQLVRYLEADPGRERRGWGWLFSAGLFFARISSQTLTNNLWAVSTTTLQNRIRVQLNTILFAKALVRKDIASSPTASSGDAHTNDEDGGAVHGDKQVPGEDKADFASKAQVMTLMTTDVTRVGEFAWHTFNLIDAPIECIIGTVFLYHLLGVSAFVGLGITCLFLPLNHFSSKVVVGAQENLMKARDERISLMNEILGGIRMLKFMAWERRFEERIMKIRDRELKYQKLNYTIETLWNSISNATPILVTLVSFWHFAVYRGETLTPSVAFTSLSVFNEMKYSINELPQTFINMLQSLVSVRRIEKYLYSEEVAIVPPSTERMAQTIILQSATITWPRARSTPANCTPSAASTPRHKFILDNLSLEFPQGELSLVCGRLGSGKTLLLLALLGEADLVTGQLLCPRSPLDAVASFVGKVVSEEEWIVPGICAYVPQTAWLRNASIRDNILFELPYVEERYHKTLEVCALLSDLEILEDGDMSEIGERGVNLSGGQKARVSLARAVYSRASNIFLDDVLSAVDAHTADYIYNECLKGDLMRERTIILVSHHIQLCASGASYVVALDRGRVQFAGSRETFQVSGILEKLSHSDITAPAETKHQTDVPVIEEIAEGNVPSATSGDAPGGAPTSVPAVLPVKVEQKKSPRKLVEEEKRAVGHVSRDVWLTYLRACGGPFYWLLFCASLGAAALSPVLENGWLKIWSGSAAAVQNERTPLYYITVYAVIIFASIILTTLQWFVLYRGGMHASSVLYKYLLEGVLFTDIRFHDTISRGTLLNRFGKDFERVDSNLPDDFGRTVMNGLAALTIYVIITVVGGLPFLLAGICLLVLLYRTGRQFGRTSRELRRLDSVTRSPLYSMYGDTISGVSVIRAFGASSFFLRDMLRMVDVNLNPYYWLCGATRWLTGRYEPITSVAVGLIGFIAVENRNISASTAAFALAFVLNLSNELTMLTRQVVGLEMSLVAVERIKEFAEVTREGPEFTEPRPLPSWPSKGSIKCEELVVRYAPDLPDVLHDINFEIKPREKVGILGRTGSGKSTLALSFFRFVDPTKGRILIDDLDISTIGLSDLRSRLTIIPQDPTIMSGTLRSTLDVFGEYKDAEIYEALRRVHLIPATDADEGPESINANVFRNLDSPVSEGGENFSTGEKQLLCMARAILKRTNVLLMDEATASVDYATDELIGKTIRQEFAESTILTIAHRIRTIIDYDKVMFLDQGRIVEFDTPAKLLSDSSSKFHALCKATGQSEFMMLQRMAGVT